MTESNAISAHGTLVYKNGVLVPELRDVIPPALSRDSFETTRMADTDDVYKVGIKKYGDLQFELNLLYTNVVHLNIISDWVNGTEDSWEIAFPDSTSWTFTGLVTSVAPDAPVDGVQKATVRVRVSGGISFFALRVTEAGEQRVLESGEDRET